MFNKFLLIAVLLSLKLLAQVSVNPEAIEFPQVFTSTSDSASFYVINHTDQVVSVELNNYKSVYILSDTALIVPANDSVIVWIKYKPIQNVIDADVVLITSSDSAIGAAIDINGIAKYGDSYDAATFNKYDVELKTALTSLVANHTSLGYNLARDKMYMEIDNQRVNGQGAAQNTLECVYTGRLAVGYTSRADAQNNYSFNTEHTWPQSTFSENEPMRSDLYHLFPTDVTANGVRANYPFGKVVSSITWQNGGSKLGNNSQGQLVFEPRDVHKGDVSRSMFYFLTRYPVNYGTFFTQTQENVFREWNKFDPVGNVESNRNSAIASFQLKRNPYIDHPEFVDRIYSFTTNNVRPTVAELNILPLALSFDSTAVGDTTTNYIFIVNAGSAALILDSITITDERFEASALFTGIDAYSVQKLEVSFLPDSFKTYSASLTIFSNGGNEQISLTGIGKDDPVSVDDEALQPLAFSLEQNYPNPFNPGTTISWQTPAAGWQTIILYNSLGEEVDVIVNEFLEAGFHSKLYIVNSTLPSGVYFYQLRAGNFVETKKMLLMK
jgi:endonuclease I